MREACEAAAARAGVSVTIYIEGEVTREAWVRALRSDEVAIICRLDLLAERHVKGRRPNADFSATLARVLQRAAYVIDAKSGISSRDARWPEIVRWASDRVASGRSLSRKRAQAMARRSRETAEPGVVELWRSPPMRDEHARWSQHWRDPTYSSSEAAFAALPERLQDKYGSVSTMRRIFGERHPDKKFGRPKAKKKR